ncbi:MAG TPA: AraC family transcriptional regulator, partial [Pseudomonadales bacterium]|nr:AraC family transcriptional regulator [Pseudomonadales bacterium]
STLATMAQATFNYLDSSGLDAPAIFKSAGLDSKDIFDPNARFPAYATNRLLQIAIRETGEECIIYRVMDYYDITMAHAMGYAWLASRNLKEALDRFVRYHRMLSSNVEINLERAQGSWQLIGKLIETGHREANEGVLVFCIHMCRISYGKDLIPINVQLTRTKPADPSPILDFYRCRVEFGCNENIILFSPSDVSQKQRGANPSLTIAMDNVITTYLARLDENDVDSQVRSIVARLLAHGEPSRDDIAEELNLAPRTLQRRLDEQDSSVKKIIDETRHQLAIEFLQHGNHSIKEIAYNLGFSDPSNFSRAFKRWEGMSPKAYQ